MTDSLFYIVVILLVILKLLIWVCVFYSRAQRSRMARCQRGILIMGQDCRRGILIPAESDSAINQDGVENPHVSAMMPPSYNEVLRTKSVEGKPPPYEQVLQSSNTYQVSGPTVPLSPPLPTDICGLPLSYTQHGHDSTYPQQQQIHQLEQNQLYQQQQQQNQQQQQQIQQQQPNQPQQHQNQQQQQPNQQQQQELNQQQQHQSDTVQQTAVG